MFLFVFVIYGINFGQITVTYYSGGPETQYILPNEAWASNYGVNTTEGRILAVEIDIDSWALSTMGQLDWFYNNISDYYFHIIPGGTFNRLYWLANHSQTAEQFLWLFRMQSLALNFPVGLTVNVYTSGHVFVL